ncbi:MAG: hypothetical protein IPK27_08295 [Rhodanobacteraceae bacterium]|nr:hypothetical protein [Rhodanobacteraceae bacterium]
MRSYLTGGSDVLVSPDAGQVYSDAWVRPVDGEDPGVQLGSDCALAQWLDADQLMRCSPMGSSVHLEIYRLASATRTEVLEVPQLRLFRLSEDGRRLLVVADLPGGAAGLSWPGASNSRSGTGTGSRFPRQTSIRAACAYTATTAGRSGT